MATMSTTTTTALVYAIACLACTTTTIAIAGRTALDCPTACLDRSRANDDLVVVFGCSGGCGLVGA